MEAMRGRKPNLIVTNQDLVMKIVIKKNFCSSSYKLCLWHIMKKVLGKLGVSSLNSNNEFNKSFKSCVWSSKTPDEFEATWNSMMIKFDLKKRNDWLSYI